MNEIKSLGNIKKRGYINGKTISMRVGTFSFSDKKKFKSIDLFEMIILEPLDLNI